MPEPGSFDAFLRRQPRLHGLDDGQDRRGRLVGQFRNACRCGGPGEGPVSIEGYVDDAYSVPGLLAVKRQVVRLLTASLDASVAKDRAVLRAGHRAWDHGGRYGSATCPHGCVHDQIGDARTQDLRRHESDPDAMPATLCSA